MKKSLALVLAVALVAAVGVSSSAFAQAQSAQTSAAQAPAASPDKSAEKDSGWDVVVYPLLAYIPLAGIDITLPPAPPCTGCQPDTPTANGDTGLSGAWFGGFRIEKGRFALEANGNYAGLKAERSTPVLNLKVNVVAASGTVGFKVVNGLYAEVGAKYYELDVTASILSFPQASWKPNTFLPLVGTTFRPQLTKRLRLHTHLDYSGFGSDWTTTNGSARFEWRPIKHALLAAGYGFSTLRVDGAIASKPINLKYTLHGPILGFGIAF
jgi:hypothetical protein